MALLLNARSRLPRGGPHGLPDADGAAADRRRPDLEDDLHARREPAATARSSSSACRSRSLITNPDTALVGHRLRRDLAVVPLHHADGAGGPADDPERAARGRHASTAPTAGSSSRYVIFPYIRPALVVAGLFRLIDSFKAFPLIYVLTNGGPGIGDRGHQLLRLRPGLQLLLLGLCQRHRHPDAGRRLLPELGGRPPRAGARTTDAYMPSARAELPAFAVPRPCAAGPCRPGANARLAMHLVAASPRCSLVLFPFLWLVQMAFRPAGRHLRLRACVFRPTLEHFAALLAGPLPALVPQQPASPARCRPALSLLLGVPAAYALTRWRFRARRAGGACGSWSTRMAPPIAFTIPFFLAYRWLGLLDTVWGLALIYLTFNLRARDLDDADLLRRRAGDAGGGGLDRRLRHLAGLLARDAAAHRTGARGHGGALLRLLLERLLLRPDPHPHRGRSRRRSRSSTSCSTRAGSGARSPPAGRW